MPDNNTWQGSYASVENLNKIEAYLLARKFGRVVWDVVTKWDYFHKKTIGDQWTRSVDSISANIAEGYGAFFFNDTVRFYYYARRSLFEANDWFSKAMERGLLTDDEVKEIRKIKKDLPFEINKLIKRVKTQRNKK